MTTTHSIDLNLTTAAEPSLTSLPSLTPLTSPGVAGERDARTYQALAGGDVRDMSGVSDARPAVAGGDASSSASVAAFRRAMAEPIAENAALGEAFAAAVAATAAEPSLTRSHGDTEAGEEAVVASGLVGARVPARPQDPAASAASLPSLDSGLTSLTPLTPLTSPDTAAAVSGEASLSSLSSLSSLGSLAVTVAGERDAHPYQAQDSEVAEPVAVGRGVLDAPTAEPNLTRSHGATKAGQTAPVAVAKGDVSGDSDENHAAPLASPSPLTSLTPPDSSLAIAGERDARPYQAVDVIAATAAVAVATTSASTTPAPTAPTAPSAVLVQAAEAVADTLLVSPGLLRGQGEIVVQLRPDVLDGTEVRIAVTGRQLDVQFCPTTVDMAVMLENGRTQIASHLSAKIASFNVTVDVRKKRA